MNLNIETTEHENYYEIKVGGELDVYTAPELQEVLQPIRQKGTHDIHVNLQDVSYLDPTGLGLFVGTLKSLNEQGKFLYVLNISERIERLFESKCLKGISHVIE